LFSGLLTDGESPVSLDYHPSFELEGGEIGQAAVGVIGDPHIDQEMDVLARRAREGPATGPGPGVETRH